MAELLVFHLTRLVYRCYQRMGDLLDTAAAPAVPAELPEILRELNRAILCSQPTDVLVFCSEYFASLLRERRGTCL